MAKSSENSEMAGKAEKEIGIVTNYYAHVGAMAIKLKAPLKVGDTIRVKGGEHTDFEQKIESMQIDRREVNQAKAGDEIGIIASEKVRKDYKVLKVS